MKQNFLDGLCALIRKSRLLANLNISKILIRSETLQNYLFFAFQLSSSKNSLQNVVWNGDFTKPALTAKFVSICLENLTNLMSVSVTPKEPEKI